MDFRIARRDAAIARRDAAIALAQAGGDALYNSAAYYTKAAESDRYANWVDSMIKAHPFTGAVSA